MYSHTLILFVHATKRCKYTRKNDARKAKSEGIVRIVTFVTLFQFRLQKTAFRLEKGVHLRISFEYDEKRVERIGLE